MKTYKEIIYKCKKCDKTIEDIENAKIDPGFVIESPLVNTGFILLQAYERKKQEKYNKKYGTENVRYRFGICKECL